MAEASSSKTRAQAYSESYEPERVDTPLPHVRGPFIHTEHDQPLEGKEEVASVNVEFDPADAEQWSRERAERRMASESERAGRALSEIVYDNLDMPLRLNAIRVQGAKSTRPSFLSAIVGPHLSSSGGDSRQGQTLRSVLRTTRELDATLHAFDIFRSVDAAIMPSPSVLSGPEDVDIVLRVHEAPRYFLKTATDVGNGEGSATATARLRNVFGGAELLEGNMTFGTRTKNAFQLRFDTPVGASPLTRFDLTAFSAHRDLSWFASCQERSKGLIARLKSITEYGVHELTYEAALREIGEVSPAASMSIRDAAGPSVKSSLSACFWRDTRDDPFIATRGHFAKLKAEYAGLGGDANFAKLEAEHSVSRPLIPTTATAAAPPRMMNGWIVSFASRAGLLCPLSGSAAGSSSSHFVDRFHLGGPTSVRMFRQNGMGPRDNADRIGGDAYWAAGASLMTPIPTKEHWPLMTHFFVNAGRLTSYKQGVGSTLESLVRQPSVTAGFGLMYRHSIVRVEANVGVPLAMHKHEGAVKGFQFGLGLSFL